MYFPAREDAIQPILAAIRAETVRIDISAWYLTERLISVAIADAYLNRGVPVRLIGDRASIFEIDQNTRREFFWLAERGIPIRLRYHPTNHPTIDHWKAGIFVGQRLVEFGSANWTTFELAPDPSNAANYHDETVLFTTDPALVDAFSTQFDRYWADTGDFLDWPDAYQAELGRSWWSDNPQAAPMSISRARLVADHPMPSSMVWEQGPAFNSALASAISRENTRIDLVVYRLTVDDITSALIARHRAGVPVRVMIEPNEYRNRTWPEFELTGARLDQLWAAGVPMRQRVHQGLTHMKTLVTSTVATNASSNFTANWQRDHNYFISAAEKPALHQAMRNQVSAMWDNPAAFGPFVPQPPFAATLRAPGGSATGVSTRPTFSWNRASWVVFYDVYLGTSPGALAFAGTVSAQLVDNPPSTYEWTPGFSLAAGTTYYWRVVGRTFATARDSSLVSMSAVSSFTTGGTASGGTPPPLPSPPPPAADGSRFELVWQNPAGAVTTWLMQGTTKVGFHQPYVGSSVWKVIGTADFNGDSELDLVWQHPEGGVVVWYLSAGTRVSGSTIFSGRTLWRLAAVGDFNADGNPDLVWQHPEGTVIAWLMNGERQVGSATFHSGSTAWKVKTSGDLNGDGHADLVWQAPGGQVAVWFFNRETRISGTSIHSGTTDWMVSGAADANGDGLDDLIWQHPSGNVVVWHMNGATQVGSGAIHNASTVWKVTGAR